MLREREGERSRHENHQHRHHHHNHRQTLPLFGPDNKLVANSDLHREFIFIYMILHLRLNSTFDITFGTIDPTERGGSLLPRPRICRFRYNHPSGFPLFHLVKLHFNGVSRSCSDKPFERLARRLGQRESRLRILSSSCSYE